jgi:hypothetical protein
MLENLKLENLKQALVEALQDEYKARATYRLVLQKFGEIRPFVNIIEAEERHIQALLPLFEKYQIPIPVDDWENRVQAPDSVLSACQAGVQAEIENGEMYERLLALTSEFPDVQRVFLNLQKASQENHLQAFQRCVQRSGNIATNREKGRGQSQRGRGGRRNRHHSSSC